MRIGSSLGGLTAARVAVGELRVAALVRVAICGPLVPRLRRSLLAGAVLDGVNVASLALMAVVTLELGQAAIIDVPTAVLAAASAIVLIRWRPNSAWLVLAGAIAGAAMSYAR